MGISAIMGSAVFVVRAHLYAIEEYSEAGVLTGTIAVPDSTSWLSGIRIGTFFTKLNKKYISRN